MMQRCDRGGAIHTHVEPVGRRRQRPPAAEHLLSRHVETALNLQRNSRAGFLGRRPEQHHLNRPEFRTEAVEKLWRDRGSYEDEDRSHASGPALRRRDPNLVLEIYDSRVLTAVSGADQVFAVIEEDMNIRPFVLGSSD